MSPAHTRRVSAGSPPVAIRAGRVTLRISSQTGRAVRPELADLDTPAVLRPVSVDAWDVELTTGSQGRLVLRPAPGDGAVFPRGSALKVTVDTMDVRLNVYPEPDVSSLAAPALLAWAPADADPGGATAAADGAVRSDRLLLWVLDIAGQFDAEPSSGPAAVPVPALARVPAEVLGPVALQARDVARELAGGPRLPAGSQRVVHLVLDASTSMRALDGDGRLADAVAATLGAAEVLGPEPPAVHVAEGPTVRMCHLQEEVPGWIAREYSPDAFGVSLDAVRRALPRSAVPRLVVVVTDDVPPDLTSVYGAGDHWRVLVLEAPSAGGVVDMRDPGQDAVVRLSAGTRPGLDGEQLRQVVRALMREDR